MKLLAEVITLNGMCSPNNKPNQQFKVQMPTILRSILADCFLYAGVSLLMNFTCASYSITHSFKWEHP